MSALERRHRESGNEPLAVHGSVRQIGVKEVGAGVSSIRAAYRPADNTIVLGWFKQGWRWSEPRSSALNAGHVLLLERGTDLVIAAAFAEEAEARAWLEKRRTYTLPAWEPR